MERKPYSEMPEDAIITQLVSGSTKNMYEVVEDTGWSEEELAGFLKKEGRIIDNEVRKILGYVHGRAKFIARERGGDMKIKVITTPTDPQKEDAYYVLIVPEEYVNNAANLHRVAKALQVRHPSRWAVLYEEDLQEVEI